MILWIILLGLVLLISYVLALRSMRDYTGAAGQSYGLSREAGQSYGLFLARNVKDLNEHLLNLMVQDLQRTDSAVSLERLFKGGESALVVFGPKMILTKFIKPLNLIELAGHTKADKSLVAQKFTLMSSYLRHIKKEDFQRA